MSALRLSRPGYPTQLIPLDDGATPYRRGANIGGAMVTARPPVSKPPRTPEQIAADAARNQAYYHADPEKALARQRAYRARMRP